MKPTSPKYRHELKYQIDQASALSLKQKLPLMLRRDPHVDPDGTYLITSLYFDNCFDKALREKRHGTQKREKFRLRYYGTHPNAVFLEKKQKINDLCLKSTAPMSVESCRDILDGNWKWLRSASDPLLQELGFKMQTQLLRPRTVVRYHREPFIYEPGNVRITFDSNICTGLSADYFLDDEILALCSSPQHLAAKTSSLILEVKYDEFLPDFIRGILQPVYLRQQSFSKYAQCRTFD